MFFDLHRSCSIPRTILFALELGAGWGHIGKIQPLAQQLAARGHRVIVATPQFDVAEQLLAGIPLRLLAIPALGDRPRRQRVLRGFGDILYNTCFHEAAQIRARSAAWQAIFQSEKPTVMVCDHAPGAMLAARASQIATIPLGTGFEIPDKVDHFPIWRPNDPAGAADSIAREKQVLTELNRWLVQAAARPLSRVSELYHDTAAQILATRPEIDCYRARQSSNYFGIWPATGGLAVRWPEHPGRKVLAYVRPFPALALLLQQLSQLTAASLVVCPGIAPELAQQYESSRVRIETVHIDLQAAAQTCDLAIGNGTHGFTTQLMLAGKPQLLIPQTLEQQLNSLRVQHHGAGCVAQSKVAKDVILKLRRLWEHPEFAEGARRLKTACDQRPMRSFGEAIRLIEETPA